MQRLVDFLLVEYVLDLDEPEGCVGWFAQTVLLLWTLSCKRFALD